MKYIRELLDVDLKINSQRYGIDRLSELYLDDGLLPTNLRLGRADLSNIEGVIKESLRAIILDEHKRLQR
jgi:hypothetical protein